MFERIKEGPMKSLFTVAACGAVAAALGTAAFAQARPAQTAAASAGRISVVGCIQSEADYRKAQGTGRGGVGAGSAVGSEFVLINASTPAAPTGTAGGAAPTGVAYELSGKNEAEAGQFVGKRVEISGVLKAADTRALGATGGATAGVPPAGVDHVSQDLKIRELEVLSVRASTSGTCPAQ
jgi:hypothetical protein